MTLEFVSDLLLPRLLAASVQSTLLVAVVWLLCHSVPRLSANTRAWLWWLVALQLLAGLFWSNPLTLPLLPAQSVQPAMAIGIPPDAWSTPPMALAGIDAMATDAAASTRPAASASAALPATPWPLAITILWICGLGVMIVATLRGYLATRRLLRESQPCRDRALLQALALAADAHGLRAAPRLRVSAAIDSPQLIGPWAPVLLLPAHHAQSMQADELDMALTHELVHLQRGDLWWGMLPSLARHLFFFHPLAHLAIREYGLAREAACDAAVLAGHRHCARRYGQLLLRLGVAPRPRAGLASASADFHILKRRLTMLHDTHHLPRIVAALVIGAVAVLGVMPYRIIAATAPVSAPATVPVTAPHSAPTTLSAPAPIAAPLAAPAPVSAPRAITVPTTSVTAPNAALAAPVAPTAPLAPSAPRAAPEARDPTVDIAPHATALRGTFTLNRQPGDRAYVLLSDDDSIAVGATSELREAQGIRKGNEDLLWMRKGNVRYVVRDSATLARLREVYDDVERLGKAQGELGERQGQLGEQQRALGSRQDDLGMQQAELASEGASRRDHAAYAERMAALAARQRAIAEDMQPLAQRQATLAREQAALAARQKAAGEQAQREAWRLMDAAIANRVAQPIRID
ncbi:M56 family metallopeptidase [Luteimonas sp. RIT-PG2_3]